MRLVPPARSPWWQIVFAEQVIGPDAIALDRAAILLSAHRSTYVENETHVERAMHTLDALSDRASTGSSPATEFEAWHRLLWIDEGFSGNGIDYHDVRNSFLPDVLDRRVGIPISLAVIGIEVGRRLGLPIYGIGMPGHFLLGCRRAEADNSAGGAGTPDGRDVIVDPFNGGAILDSDGILSRFQSMFGDEQPFDESYLSAVSAEAILVRMLANLKQNYARMRDVPGLLAVMRLRSTLADTSITEGRELVRLLHVVGETADALDVCDQIEQAHPQAHTVIDGERDRIAADLN